MNMGLKRFLLTLGFRDMNLHQDYGFEVKMPFCIQKRIDDGTNKKKSDKLTTEEAAVTRLVTKVKNN